MYCELLKNTNFIKIKVKDQGIGIKDEDKEKLFVPFELLEHGKALNPSGTGIGLSSCHKMLTAIGCSIYRDDASVVGMGSIFSFTILFKKVVNHRSQGKLIKLGVSNKNKKPRIKRLRRHPNFGSR